MFKFRSVFSKGASYKKGWVNTKLQYPLCFWEDIGQYLCISLSQLEPYLEKPSYKSNKPGRGKPSMSVALCHFPSPEDLMEQEYSKDFKEQFPVIFPTCGRLFPEEPGVWTWQSLPCLPRGGERCLSCQNGERAQSWKAGLLQLLEGIHLCCQIFSPKKE